MTHTSAGSGHAGLSFPDTEHYVRHIEDIVLHLGNTVDIAVPFSDVRSSEPWAKDNGSGLLVFDPGVYLHWVNPHYSPCDNDCDFLLFVVEPVTDLIGVACNFHAPAGTSTRLITTGINVYPYQSGLNIQMQANNAVDPSFTIHQVDVYTVKLA